MNNIEFKPFREIKVCADCLNNDVCKKQHDIEANPGLCAFYKRRDDYRKERVGKWIKELIYSRNWDDYHKLTCSVCGICIDDTALSEEDYKYCPNCGARMKGE